jgi:hypothetical protein
MHQAIALLPILLSKQQALQIKARKIFDSFNMAKSRQLKL